MSKPELNGKFGTVLRVANEAGRLGVRLEGGKESKSQPWPSSRRTSSWFLTSGRSDPSGANLPPREERVSAPAA